MDKINRYCVACYLYFSYTKANIKAMSVVIMVDRHTPYAQKLPKH